VYECLATTYGQLFFQTEDVMLLGKTIDKLKKAITLDPKNASALAKLTAAYSNYSQKDSARKYLILTDKLDPEAINPEVRTMLNEN
jgi:Flp pilus assembly protein TadD